MDVLSPAEFENVKNLSLSGKDLSRKGNIDEPIIDIVNLINSEKNFYTTSSCSGRLIIIANDSNNQKKGCPWLYTNHGSENKVDEIWNCLNNHIGNSVMKFEPLILHIQCRTLLDAKQMQTCVLNSGYRNSGIILGKHGKITLAVRSTLNMEVPIAKYEGNVMISLQYLEHLVATVNKKMEENKKQTKNLLMGLKQVYQPELQPLNS